MDVNLYLRFTVWYVPADVCFVHATIYYILMANGDPEYTPEPQPEPKRNYADGYLGRETDPRPKKDRAPEFPKASL